MSHTRHRPLWVDVSATPARILVPTSLQRIVFESMHRIAHPGLKAGLMLTRAISLMGGGDDMECNSQFDPDCYQSINVQEWCKASLCYPYT